MVAEVHLEIRGIESLEDFENLPSINRTAASRAVNFAARKARTESSRHLREQIAFSARYLVGENGKISIKPSNRQTLTSVLAASSAPRSLARFITGSLARRRGRGVNVQVQPGGTRNLPGAFVINVRGGNSESSNTLLAVRSPGRPRSAYRPRKIGDGVWSLYGPSVAQALISSDGKGIWPELEAEIAARLETEYLRQLQLEGF